MINNKVNKAIQSINLVYYLIFLLTIVLVTVGYFINMGNIEIPHIEEVSDTGRTLSSIYIIYLLVSIPLAVYGFNKQTKKWKEMADIDEMLKKYVKGSKIRLAVIGIGLIFGIILVYILNSRSMIFCAAIGAIMLYISKPTAKKVHKELEINEEN